MSEGKTLFQSKTVWFNILTGAASVLAYGLSNAAEFLPPQYALLASAVGNLLLRYVTKEPVTSVL